MLSPWLRIRGFIEVAHWTACLGAELCTRCVATAGSAPAVADNAGYGEAPDIYVSLGHALRGLHWKYKETNDIYDMNCLFFTELHTHTHCVNKENALLLSTQHYFQMVQFAV
jgi:hypothetical protein